jgi:hypothetical protein
MKVLIKIALVIGVSLALYLTAAVVTGDHYWCFKDRDTCTLQEIEYWRNLKEETNKRLTDNYNEQMANSNDYFDNKKINPLKLTLSAAAVMKEAKEGDKRNVPKDFFTLKSSLVPIARADENRGDGWINDVEIKDQDSISTAQGSKKPLRYQALLKSVGSPYASVDIESYCLDAKLTQYQCDILVGIAHSESASGTNFVSTKLPREDAIRLGKEVYHNPVGLKKCIEIKFMDKSPFSDEPYEASTACPEPTKIPDENGMWIQKYDSWEVFWITYTHQMKDRYFDRGADSPASISRSYVGKNGSVKTAWVNRVESFISKL